MADSLRCLSPESVITGWDFSTGAVKCLAFDLTGKVLAETRFPTDLWTDGGVSELNLLMLEGQARASTREIAHKLRELGRLSNWVAGGISATHHTAGRIDAFNNPIRRAICWNDQTLAAFHAKGLARLGGPEEVLKHIGAPWAVRYSLSHLVKDEETLSEESWQKTRFMLLHGPLAAGYLTGRFDVTSISSAASTGIMDFRTNRWSRAMLQSIANPAYQESAWKTLPRIVEDMNEPIGPLSESLALEAGVPNNQRPLIFPTSDDQAAGLIGGGAVEPGQVAIILGNSAVVNSSSDTLPSTSNLDAMRLNWGPYLWMRCYSNGAQFLDRVVGSKPDWAALEKAARAVPPGCNGVSVLPFILSEPSLGVHEPRVQWFPQEPSDPGIRFRAALEALAYLIALGVQAHEKAGQKVKRITVSGGISQSRLMGEILASTLNHPLERLQSNEGTALGAAVTALAAVETYQRRQKGIQQPFLASDAVAQMVQFRDPVQPVSDWLNTYQTGLRSFEKHLG